jgi:quinoprotein glucose dehydrogenase
LSGVREFAVKPSGATYKLARNDWFIQDMLATDCDFGPDGGLYVADWIEGWGGVGKGRIDRVVSDDPATTKERLATAEVLKAIRSKPVAELPVLLGHADMAVRLAAQRRLVAAGLPSADSFSKIASSKEAPRLARLHAIWGLGQLAEQDSKLFTTLAAMLGDDDAEVRAQAAKTLERAGKLSKDQRELISKPLLPSLADQSPRVRLFAALTLGRLKCEAALPGLLALARENDNKEAVLRHAAAFGLAESQAPETLIAATAKAGDAERLAIGVALGRQKSPLVAKLLNDSNERVRLEVARVIWDKPIPAAYAALARILDAAPSSDEPLVRRALAANQAGRTADNLRAMVRCALRPDLSAAMREHAWGLIREWPSPSPRDPVHGDWRPLPSRHAEEARAVLEESLPTIRERGAEGALGIVVAAELGVREAFASLMEIIETQSYPQELRARAVAAIGGAEEAVASQAIDAAIKSEQAEVRSAARRLLVQRLPARAVEPLCAAAESGTIAERQTALDLLATIDRPEAAAVVTDWMERVTKGNCPPELVLNVIEAAARSKNPKLVTAQKAYSDKLAAAGPVASQSASLIGGDAEHGRKLFSESEALACRRCLGVVPGKVLVGPNLADVGLRRTRNELLESIVAPNAKIAEGFKTTVFLLDSGKVVAGIVKRQDAKHAVLVDPENKELDVNLEEVENRSEGLSAMPQDIAKQLSPRDLRDLVEYLTTLRTPNTPAAEQPKDSEHAATAQ